MEEYKKEFIEFMVRSGVLTFGDFTTKSGRKTPYFINTGKYSTGEQIARLGEFYARALQKEFGREECVLFGPAYKGIPLVVTAASALYRLGQSCSFCFNRKEVKDHGEGGSLVGHELRSRDRVIIVEDVTTAGTSVYETVPQLRAAADVSLAGLMVSVDRMEKGQNDMSAFEQLERDFSLKPRAIVTVREIMNYLHNRVVDGTIYVTDTVREKMEIYLECYGV
ncbi:MAG: orotate phosphoribosyltransferase [Fibrobacterota bacterium]